MRGAVIMQTEQGTNEVIETMSHFMTLARGRRDLSKLKQDTIITWLRRRYAETHPDDYAEYQRRFGMRTSITSGATVHSVKHPTGDEISIIQSTGYTIRIEIKENGVERVSVVLVENIAEWVEYIPTIYWLTGDEQAFLLKHLTGVGR